MFGTIDVQYLDDKAELEKADAIIDGILQKIASYELYDKLLYIADYICNATQYGSQELPGGGYDAINGAYDVLTGVRTNTVCTSYALTFQRFMERADIDSYLLSNNYHVWNLVLVDGLWYGIDCTSDAGNKIDRSSFLMGSQSMARYPTDQLDPVSVFAKEHKISKTDYQKNAPATQRTTKATKKPVASTTVASVIESTTTATATTTTVTETSTASTTTTLALPISV
ncbi:MAG: hypothetical protein IJZ13_04005, partial [Clostridia bacterium]|nr:hypothetical protein [Clostridia bacterium]